MDRWTEARKRCERATVGPWEAVADMDGGPHLWQLGEDGGGEEALMLERHGQGMVDAEFCAYARMDLPAALDHIEAQERRIEELEVGLELTRMSVELIMAREGCSLEMDREAKLQALKTINETLELERG